ncbi:PH domain-containing protein [Haloarcula laminariae]|uniref:PH domain-containing protein n=1 Tax=Haloarcula laminariae TaxID=2961577 RepID=UPI0021C5E3C5|nr:PH domain-containing protein [Halomicroarcula laminariae]
MTQKSDTETESEAEEQRETDETELLRTRPTIRPTLVRLGVVLVVGLALFGVLRARPRLLGEPSISKTAALVVALITLVLVIRFVVRIIILKQTTYVITADRVELSYELLFRVRSKGVRFDKLRSHELNQNRVQSLLGYGTLSLNRGLGPIRLENVEEPELVYRTIRQCVRQNE